MRKEQEEKLNAMAPQGQARISDNTRPFNQVEEQQSEINRLKSKIANLETELLALYRTLVGRGNY